MARVSMVCVLISFHVVVLLFFFSFFLFDIGEYQTNDILQQINSALHSVALEGGNMAVAVAVPCILLNDCTKH